MSVVARETELSSMLLVPREEDESDFLMNPHHQQHPQGGVLEAEYGGLEQSLDSHNTSFGLDIIREEEDEDNLSFLSRHDESIADEEGHSCWNAGASTLALSSSLLGPIQGEEDEPHESFLQDDLEGSFASPCSTYADSWKQPESTWDRPHHGRNHSYSSSEKSSLVVLQDDDDEESESSYYSLGVDALVESILQEQCAEEDNEVEETSVSQDPEGPLVQEQSGSQGESSTTTTFPLTHNNNCLESQDQHHLPSAPHERHHPEQLQLRNAWDEAYDEDEAFSSESSLSTLAVSHDSIRLCLPGPSQQHKGLPSKQRRRRRCHYLIVGTFTVMFMTVFAVHRELSRRKQLRDAAMEQRREAALRRRTQPQRPLWLLLEEL